MKIGLLLSLVIVSGLASAQVRQPIDRRSLLLQPNQLLTVRYDQPYTSVVIRLSSGQSLSGAYIVAADDTIRFTPEPHAADGQPASTLCVFGKPITQLDIYTGTLAGEVTLQSLYVPPLPAGYVQAQMQALTKGARANCEKPTVVPVSVWRRGLTPPKELPIQTKVQFVVVHHSAGSNTPKDYTEEVRNIYVFHTQSNGWNDVGYNFLIGRDGSIFEGRDGQGLIDGDNVLGAHFCGQNSGTMGICLMGNFNDVQPSDVSLAALDQLIGWKLKKEGLQPVGTSLHAGSGKVLNKISGHRDGSCSTECPGENLYAKMPAIRQDVANACSFGPLVLATEPTIFDWTVYPNPGRDTFTVHYRAVDAGRVSFDLVDGVGRQMSIRARASGPDQWQITLDTVPSGLYWLRCRDGEQTTVRKLWRGQE